MEPLVRHKGVVAPLDKVNVDTDQIIPKQFLKRVQRTGLGRFLFYDWRYLENEALNDEFVLNNPLYDEATILLTRHNFGCGSSREHAPWALLDYGFRVIIAPSFADIFYNNCFKNGILPIVLPHTDVDELFSLALHQTYDLTIDLRKQIICDESGLQISFTTDDYRRHMLLNGMDDISVTEIYESYITAYENSKRALYQKVSTHNK